MIISIDLYKISIIHTIIYIYTLYIYTLDIYIYTQLDNVYVWTRLYVEEHDPSWGLEGATQSSMQTAMAGLRTDVAGYTIVLME
jgi:hypothetical protein